MQGRVIANGVGYNNYNDKNHQDYDDNLLPIPSQDYKDGVDGNGKKDEMFADVISAFSKDQEIGDQKRFAMTDIYFIKDDQTIKANYDITPEQIEAQCGLYCTSCEYDVTFRLLDITNSIVIEEYKVTSPGGALVTNGVKPTLPTLLSGTLTKADETIYFDPARTDAQLQTITSSNSNFSQSSDLPLTITASGLFAGHYRVERYVGLSHTHKEVICKGRTTRL